jgi:hypothetical protein
MMNSVIAFAMPSKPRIVVMVMRKMAKSGGLGSPVAPREPGDGGHGAFSHRGLLLQIRFSVFVAPHPDILHLGPR